MIRINKLKIIAIVLIVLSASVLPTAFSVSLAKWTGGSHTISADVSVGQWSNYWGDEASIKDWITSSGDKNMGVASSVDDPENAIEREGSGYTNYKRWYKLTNMSVGAQFQVFASNDVISNPNPIKCAAGQYVQRLYADKNGNNPLDINDTENYGAYKHISDGVGDDLGENGSWKINNQVYQYVKYLGNGVFEVVNPFPEDVSASGDLMVKITLVLNGFNYVHTVDICSFEQYTYNKTGA